MPQNILEDLHMEDEIKELKIETSPTNEIIQVLDTIFPQFDVRKIEFKQESSPIRIGKGHELQ